jgi:hypothetical protein
MIVQTLEASIGQLELHTPQDGYERYFGEYSDLVEGASGLEL